jgi:YebC/PmpR family DNA-binding regulatory protein
MMNGGFWPAMVVRRPLSRRPFHQQQQRNMAGHNKWSKIKRKKGVKDQARATGFSKASRAITAASRTCGGDLSNLQLQSAIAHAKSIQLPKIRIQDAIDKHLDKTKENLIHMRYDAMMSIGGHKVACVLTALTNNKNRTASHVRSTITKAGGELLPTSSLNYIFDHVGVILVENIKDEDSLWEAALEAGATDVDVDGQSAMITCNASDLWNVVTTLKDDECFHVTEFEQRYVASNANLIVNLDENGQEQLEHFLETMDDDEDVTNVYHNAIVDEH